MKTKTIALDFKTIVTTVMTMGLLLSAALLPAAQAQAITIDTGATTHSEQELIDRLIELIKQLQAQLDEVSETNTEKENRGVFSIGARVATTDILNVRKDFGIFRQNVGSQKNGSEGTVVIGPESANGYTWWWIDYDSGPDGWSAGAWLKDKAEKNDQAADAQSNRPDSWGQGDDEADDAGDKHICRTADGTIYETYDECKEGEDQLTEQDPKYTCSDRVGNIFRDSDCEVADSEADEAVDEECDTATESFSNAGQNVDQSDCETEAEEAATCATPFLGCDDDNDGSQGVVKGASNSRNSLDDMTLDELIALVNQLKAEAIASQGNTSTTESDTAAEDTDEADGELTKGMMVQTTDSLRVRNQPGLSGYSKGNQPAGAKGEIVAGPVEASGYTWWKVVYESGVNGWSAADWLEAVSETTTESDRAEEFSLQDVESVTVERRGGDSADTWTSLRYDVTLKNDEWRIIKRYDDQTPGEFEDEVRSEGYTGDIDKLLRLAVDITEAADDEVEDVDTGDKLTCVDADGTTYETYGACEDDDDVMYCDSWGRKYAAGKTLFAIVNQNGAVQFATDGGAYVCTNGEWKLGSGNDDEKTGTTNQRLWRTNSGILGGSSANQSCSRNGCASENVGSSIGSHVGDVKGVSTTNLAAALMLALEQLKQQLLSI